MILLSGIYSMKALLRSAIRSLLISFNSADNFDGKYGPRLYPVSTLVWLSGVVVSGFESQVAPLFHWVATLGK